MKVKIKRIHIENFKPFQNFPRDFPKDNLIVLDGPNGFGKTSFYDAIEILFTGGLRRYQELIDSATDGRSTVSGNPLLNNLSDTGDLIIKAELDINGESFFFMRKEFRSKLEKETKFNSINIPLYSLEYFEDPNPTLIEKNKEDDILSPKFGKDYIRDFEHLNYIEQQENLYLLKGTDKQRKDAIDHLFNTSDFQERLSQITDALRKIRKLCNKETKNTLKDMERELKDCKKNLIPHGEPISFSRIITWKDISWDQKDIKFTDDQYSKWLQKDGEIDKISFFVKNYENFKAHRGNGKIDGLLENKALILQYLQYWKFLDQEPQHSADLKLYQSMKQFMTAFEKGILENVENGKDLLTPDLEKFLNNNEFDLTQYKQSLSDIEKKKNRTNSLSRLLVGIKETRQEFINKFKKYEEQTNPDRGCPLCGYAWNDADELRQHFDLQSTQLELIINETGTDLNLAILNFSTTIIEPIISFLKVTIAKHPVDTESIIGLQQAIKKQTELTDLNRQLMALKLDTSPFFVKELTSSSHQSNLTGFYSALNKMKQKADPSNLRPYFDTVFLKVFEENHKHVLQITTEGLTSKRKYIEWQYALYQSDVIKSDQKKYDVQLERFTRTEEYKYKLIALQKIYKNSLEQYQKKFISNIEILFHIYSGRIAQDSKNSLGLFIDAEKGIRFLESHDKTHDAVFSMSSGQLATLIISFTLALNQRFSENKLLFIDDPVQTLDELNVAGFIELLRNDFSDHQIFISTHEDTMSAYMRYKFEKYGLGATRLSFKETQL